MREYPVKITEKALGDMNVTATSKVFQYMILKSKLSMEIHF